MVYKCISCKAWWGWDKRLKALANKLLTPVICSSVFPQRVQDTSLLTQVKSMYRRFDIAQYITCYDSSHPDTLLLKLNPINMSLQHVPFQALFIICHYSRITNYGEDLNPPKKVFLLNTKTSALSYLSSILAQVC